MGERVGYRFRPTDIELINHFLKHKMLGNDAVVAQDIGEVKITDFDPRDLPMQAKKCTGDPEWYFFCLLDKKYSKGERISRKTSSGFWKPTGIDRDIKYEGNKIGKKKTLVYYKKNGENKERTDWVIHEYHACFIPPNQKAYVLCKLIYKGGEGTSTTSEANLPIQAMEEPLFEIDGFYLDPPTLDDVLQMFDFNQGLEF